MAKTILVAEDHTICRALAREHLTRQGFEVIEAGNGLEAVEKYLLNADKIDLLLLDILMPGMNGRDAYEKMRESGCKCPVLFCSGFTGDKLDAEFKLEINQELLKKPYSGEELIKRIFSLLGLTEK